MIQLKEKRRKEHKSNFKQIFIIVQFMENKG